MYRRHSARLLPAAAALVLTGAGFADHPTGADPDQLRARIGQLEAQVRCLEATNGARWLTEQRADEIRSLVQDVLADADTASSLRGVRAERGFPSSPRRPALPLRTGAKRGGYAQR